MASLFAGAGGCVYVLVSLYGYATGDVTTVLSDRINERWPRPIYSPTRDRGEETTSPEEENITTGVPSGDNLSTTEIALIVVAALVVALILLFIVSSLLKLSGPRIAKAIAKTTGAAAGEGGAVTQKTKEATAAVVAREKVESVRDIVESGRTLLPSDVFPNLEKGNMTKKQWGKVKEKTKTVEKVLREQRKAKKSGKRGMARAMFKKNWIRLFSSILFLSLMAHFVSPFERFEMGAKKDLQEVGWDWNPFSQLEEGVSSSQRSLQDELDHFWGVPKPSSKERKERSPFGSLQDKLDRFWGVPGPSSKEREELLPFDISDRGGDDPEQAIVNITNQARERTTEKEGDRGVLEVHPSRGLAERAAQMEARDMPWRGLVPLSTTSSDSTHTPVDIRTAKAAAQSAVTEFVKVTSVAKKPGEKGGGYRNSVVKRVMTAIGLGAAAVSSLVFQVGIIGMSAYLTTHLIDHVYSQQLPEPEQREALEP